MIEIAATNWVLSTVFVDNRVDNRHLVLTLEGLLANTSGATDLTHQGQKYRHLRGLATDTWGAAILALTPVKSMVCEHFRSASNPFF